MTSSRITLAALALTALAVGACSEAPLAPEGTAKLRVVAASPDVASLAVVINGDTVIRNLAFGGVDSATVTPVTKTVVVVARTAVLPDAPPLTLTPNLVTNTDFLLVVSGRRSATANTLRTSGVIQSGGVAIPSGQAGVRVFNASSAAGTRDFYLFSGTAPTLTTQRTYAGVTANGLNALAYTFVAPGALSLDTRAAPSTTTPTVPGTSLFATSVGTVAAGQLYTVVLADNATTPTTYRYIVVREQ